MSCHNCARRTLSLFIRSLVNTESTLPLRPTTIRNAQPSRFFTTARHPYKPERAEEQRPKDVIEDITEEDTNQRRERPSWQLQKAALKEKLGGEAWNPRKRLSPDTVEGIRHLHNTQPTKFTTPVLAQHFKVSAEAIRRILKSKWQPSDEQYEDRMQRWSKRGERIWTNMVELGVKPPKQWRDMGVGRATNGQRPKWKSRHRNMVDVRDSASDNFVVEDGDIIPIVDGSGKSRRPIELPLSQRL
ncbi:required for respiratory growth protein 9, mitochondrial [Ophiobolus disseminans]|uniref:Required for respiratory growth protein 9, mitochondrial n=1 Tax=Ophiobolus disseminans TaxID=1469910 RepID=A0A6A7AAW5_9PLEO|nr:required for respiratory growth protein 9, mitochondrial [Ophiobolus disseminans]